LLPCRKHRLGLVPRVSGAKFTILESRQYLQQRATNPANLFWKASPSVDWTDQMEQDEQELETRNPLEAPTQQMKRKENPWGVKAPSASIGAPPGPFWQL
jgi:hypothetical protein